MAGLTHYERLGVRPDAPVDEIRRAYRDVARLHHPDAAGSAAGSGTGTSAGADMAAVNEAWRVLSDQGRRAVYDASLRPRAGAGASAASGSAASGSAASGSAARTEREEQLERLAASGARSGRLPIWPFVLIFVLAAIFILTTGAISQDPKPAPPDELLFAGSCVRIEANQDVVEVDCGGAHDGLVVALVDFDQSCPSGSVAHRDRQGRGWACVGPG